MGRVYFGSTPEGRQAAVKVIREDLVADPQFRQRFRREVSAAVAVAGLFTARVVDADPEAVQPWLATEFVNGPSLRDAVREFGPMPGHAVVTLAAGLAAALSSIHAAGLVHRDVKPANVLLAPEGPRVIDFGIAASAEWTALTTVGSMPGTLEYMSPEQVSGDRGVGAASDVFSFASTVVFAATGRAAFSGESPGALMHQILSGEPDLQGVPAQLVGIVRACLDKDPARRPSAAHLAAWLRGGDPTAAGGLVGPGVVPAPREPGAVAGSLPSGEGSGNPGWSVRGWRVWSLLSGVAVLVVVGITVWPLGLVTGHLHAATALANDHPHATLTGPSSAPPTQATSTSTPDGSTSPAGAASPATTTPTRLIGPDGLSVDVPAGWHQIPSGDSNVEMMVTPMSCAAVACARGEATISLVAGANLSATVDRYRQTVTKLSGGTPIGTRLPDSAMSVSGHSALDSIWGERVRDAGVIEWVLAVDTADHTTSGQPRYPVVWVAITTSGPQAVSQPRDAVWIIGTARTSSD